MVKRELLFGLVASALVTGLALGQTHWAQLTNGIVGVPRPYAERAEGAVELPVWVRSGDVQDGTNWLRGGSIVVPPPYTIPVARVFAELTDEEWATLIQVAFPGANVPLARFLLRASYQEALDPTNSRVTAAIPAFQAMLGTNRVDFLLRRP